MVSFLPDLTTKAHDRLTVGTASDGSLSHELGASLTKKLVLHRREKDGTSFAIFWKSKWYVANKNTYNKIYSLAPYIPSSSGSAGAYTFMSARV